MMRLVYLLLFLTGSTGLIYQVVWQKYLAILLGSHASSTAAILALFFVFMSLGYGIIGRYSAKLFKNQLVLYGIIELVIGIYALYSHPFFEGIFSYFVEKSQGQDGLAFALLVCAAFIGFPTFLMGGTIPVLTQALSQTDEMSGDIHARVYGLNTLGAVLGCLVAGYYMIEHFGLESSLILAGNINVVIALITFWIAAKSSYSFEGPEISKDRALVIPNASLLVVISFLSGMYTFGFETLIIRMISLSVGSTSYAYSIVVSAFIVSIAIGSLVIARSKWAQKPRFLSLTMLAAVLSFWLLFMSVELWPEWFYRARVLYFPGLYNFSIYNFTTLVLAIMILLIPVSLIGANLPLLFNVLQASSSQNLSRLVGRLYSVNAIGSGIGAVTFGYLLFEYLPADKIFRLCLVALVIAAALSIWVVVQKNQRKVYITILAILSLGITLTPGWNVKSFVPGAFVLGHPNRAELDWANTIESHRANEEILFSRFDPNTHASVTKSKQGGLSLLVNGKVDSSTGKGSDDRARVMAALTPLSIKSEKVEDVFIVGLGAGLSTGVFASFPEVQSVEVAEISEGVIEALPFFEEFNHKLVENMNKVTLHVGDAYRELMLKDKKYDLIVSEPSNPWVSGIEKIFTQEFYELGRDRLKNKGLYVQWFPLFFMPEATAVKILATFNSVFPNTIVFGAASGAITVVGGMEPIELNQSVLQERFDSYPQAFTEHGYSSVEAVWLKQILTELQVDIISYKQEEFHSLFHPDLEYKSGKAFFAGINASLGDILRRHTVLPFDRNNDESGKYLYEQNTKSLKYKAFEEAFLASRSRHWDHFNSSLVLNFFKLFPSSKEFPNNKKLLQDKYYLLGQKKSWDNEIMKQSPERYWNKLLIDFKTLVALGEMPKLSRLQRHLDDVCPGADCKKRKWSSLVSLAPKAQLEELTSKGSDGFSEEEINRRWSQVLETYKKIGAY